MTATTSPRLTSTAGPIPSKGTLPMPANTLLLKGTIVSLRSIAPKEASAEATRTGLTILRKDIPAARKATISLCEESRPKVNNDDRSEAMGRVITTTSGNL